MHLAKYISKSLYKNAYDFVEGIKKILLIRISCFSTLDTLDLGFFFCLFLFVKLSMHPDRLNIVCLLPIKCHCICQAQQDFLL